MIYFIAIFLLLWLNLLYRNYYSIFHLKTLDSFPVNISDTPLISIVIAVRDGEKELEATLGAMLKSNYENLEIIIVNDRSVDRTKNIIEEVKLRDSRLKSIHIDSLPVGWLGKVHALHKGSEIASGEFLLFMDSDIIINEIALHKAISICREFKLDHLALVPSFISGGFFLDTTITASMIMFISSAKTWLSLEKRPAVYARGVGAFNFVRREFLLKTEGFSWLKMDVADDVALSLLIANSGGRSTIALASEKNGPSLKYYENFKEMVLGFEKNLIGGLANYKIHLVVLITALNLIVFAVPLYCFIQYTNAEIIYLGLLFWFFNFIFSLSIYKKINKSFLEVFFFPLGLFIFGFVLLRSAIIFYKNGGIRWRGTFYPAKELKDGCRVRFTI